MSVQTDENGRVDVRSVDDLSPDALSDWIWARLHDEDAAVPTDPREAVGQYYRVGAIYKDLLPGTQAEVRRVLERFLRQLESDHHNWRGRPGDDLLLLTMELGEPSLSAPIRRMAESEQFLHGAQCDEARHARLLQALIYLNEKVTPAFWREQLERDPRRYATLAFSGLLMHSLYQALCALARLDLADEHTQADLYSSVRGLLASKRYNRDDLRRALGDLSGKFSNATSDFLQRALPELERAGVRATE